MRRASCGVGWVTWRTKFSPWHVAFPGALHCSLFRTATRTIRWVPHACYCVLNWAILKRVRASWLCLPIWRKIGIGSVQGFSFPFPFLERSLFSCYYCYYRPCLREGTKSQYRKQILDYWRTCFIIMFGHLTEIVISVKRTSDKKHFLVINCILHKILNSRPFSIMYCFLLLYKVCSITCSLLGWAL